ncbi:MAG TPA: Gfo/Idh/MocA family oxidoreductase [Kiritimatiellia bacterium]|nr:Gfo/Idh/MocA family oxidoreductase [Kiritimatiellia bacterium]HRU69627.1 Gfo/Idh/MocA family oxidoreductase [Kiritimatiellia bacterium]
MKVEIAMGQGIGFAIIGTGLIARVHACAVQAIGARLVAVCSRQMSRAETFAAEFGCAAYTDLEAMLARPDVQILVIATPSGAHLEAAVCAAHAHKHVLCEKPLDVTLERVDAMIAAHRHAGTTLGCTFQFRYAAALDPLRAAIREGRFGRITAAGVYVPWWRSDAYYHGSSWHGTQALDGGGALMNQGIHMVDLLCDLMPPVETVCGMTAAIGHSGLETEDVACAALRFKGGALGMVYGSTAAWPGYPKRLEISGTRGTAVFVDDRLTVFDFAEPRPEDQWVLAAGASPACGAGDPAAAMTHGLHAACFRDFLDAVESHRPFRIDGASARRSVATVLAIYESARTGRSVQVES